MQSRILGRTQISGRTGPTLLGLALSGALGLAGPALAQGTGGTHPGTTAPAASTTPVTPASPTAPATPVTPAPMTPAASQPGGSVAQTRRASAQAEQQIARLHRELRITPSQSGQWDAFAEVMRENAEHTDSLNEQRMQSIGTMSAVDGLKSYEQLEEAHAADLQKLVPAFQTLYDSFSDAQKKSADQLFRARAEQRNARPASARAE
ncbi:MAG: Spy/CpxP family protein refolding chaperone [Acidisphaera sp.]|nr:Spy/CpxP family protein refolding chaperone [Acidisphaera sp.]